MPIPVVQVASIVDGEIILPDRPRVQPGVLVGFLTALNPNPAGDGPDLNLNVRISDGPNAQTIPMSIGRVLSAAEVKQAFLEPFPLPQLQTAQQHLATAPPSDDLERFRDAGDHLWLFRDEFYSTTRRPRQSEQEEVLLRIKAMHFQHADTMKRLREQVANFEAVEAISRNRVSRQPIPDDVKLFVWARDAGSCVRCGASSDLHFDHIIPLSRGGGDHAENIQLLCRTCNLTKSNRLA